MQITINVKDGANAEAIARALRFQANLLDGIEPKKAASNKYTAAPNGAGKPKPDEDEEETEEVEEDEAEDETESEDDESDSDSDEEDEDESDDADESDDESEDDEESDESEDEEESEEEDEEPAKKAKPKKGKVKLSAKDEKMLKAVNAALRKKAEKTSFDDVKEWLFKKFKVKSISALKPTQFAAVIKACKPKPKAA